MNKSETFLSKARRAGQIDSDIRGKPDRWEIVRPLNRGTTGAVYLVQEKGKRNAPLRVLKIPLAPTMADSLRTEIKALQMLDHPNIVKLIDANIDTGMPWLVEEFHDVQTLRDTNLRSWTRQQLLELYHKVYRVVKFLHSKGLLIGDLCPVNILLEGEEPILIDLEHCYISDKTKFDKRNDIFQLGVLYDWMFYRKDGGKN